MKQEALAFIKILPAGAADIGPDVSREELREAGVGAWSASVTHRDDVGCLFDPEELAERPAELPPEFDYVVPTTDEAPAASERTIRLRFGTHG